MIEINLLPGAAKKAKGKGTGISLGAVFSDARARVRDPFMLSAVGSVLLAAAVVGGLHFSQAAYARDLGAREEQAVSDSTRFGTVLRERRRAIAKRDSVMKQLQVIRSIDEDRFIWPHIMDEVSRAMPPYTWLKSITVQAPTQLPPSAAADTGRKDPTPAPEPMRFRLVGNTVDIQALTRFMKLLEASPFVQNVQLARSEIAMVDGKEVTQFSLDAQYERPDRSLLTTAPVSLSVR